MKQRNEKKTVMGSKVSKGEDGKFRKLRSLRNSVTLSKSSNIHIIGIPEEEKIKGQKIYLKKY